MDPSAPKSSMVPIPIPLHEEHLCKRTRRLFEAVAQAHLSSDTSCRFKFESDVGALRLQNEALVYMRRHRLPRDKDDFVHFAASFVEWLQDLRFERPPPPPTVEKRIEIAKAMTLAVFGTLATTCASAIEVGIKTYNDLASSRSSAVNPCLVSSVAAFKFCTVAGEAVERTLALPPPPLVPVLALASCTPIQGLQDRHALVAFEGCEVMRQVLISIVISAQMVDSLEKAW